MFRLESNTGGLQRGKKTVVGGQSGGRQAVVLMGWGTNRGDTASLGRQGESRRGSEPPLLTQL